VIAEAGFRAVAIDVRGYWRSSAPLEVEAYGMLQHVSDNLGVVEALAGRGSPAIVIGHDWGAQKWDGQWQYHVRGGRFEHPGGGAALVFEVRPAKVIAFAKDRFGQTRYRFS
jgi:pimeloyl-ACP methyl ester carboxylesterase